MSDLSCGKILPPKEGVYQGAFVADTVSESALDSFAEKSGTEVDIALKFMAFATGLYFPTREAQAVSKKGGVIFVKLEPWSGEKDKNKSSFPLKKIIKGEYDYLLKRFAQGARDFGKPIFVSFAHEMNGNWYPWSGNPKLYRKAFQHVHQVISDVAPNVTWVWNPNVDFPAAPYYPGDKYVDWVAIDGYNWNGDTPIPSALNGLDYLKTLNKPVMIGEFACAKDNAACLTNFVDFVAKDKSIKAFIYFDEDKEKKWAINKPAEKAAYHAAIKKNEDLFKSRIRVVPCQEPAAAVEEKPAEPESGMLPLGKEGEWSLSRAMVIEQIEQGNLSLDQIEKILQILSKMPSDTVLDPEVYRYSAEKFRGSYPELSQIKGISGSIYHYLCAESFAHHWDNAIRLLSVYSERVIESTSDKKHEKIETALEIARGFRERIAAQKTADKASIEKRAPSNYLRATFDLTVAELYSQSKDKDEIFYQEGIQTAVLALHGFLAVKHDKSSLSEPDYFSIGKGIITLADLHLRLARLCRNESEAQKYYEKAYALYGSIAEMEAPSSVWEAGKGLTVNLPEFSLHIDVSASDINDALMFNLWHGYIDEEGKDLSRIGTFSFLKGIATIKQAALFAGWPRLKDPEEYLLHLSRISQGIKEIKRWNKHLIDLHGKDPNSILSRSDFSFTLAGLIQGELLLGLADHIKYTPIKSEEWENLIRVYLALFESIENECYDWALAALPGISNNAEKNALADQLIRIAKDDYFIPNENGAYSYLYAWSKVKQLEIQVRLAEYIKYLDRSGRITENKKKQVVMFADIEKLLDVRGKVISHLEKNDFLRLEIDLLTASLMLSGTPERKGDRFRILSIGGRRIAKKSQPSEALALLDEIKLNLSHQPALNQKYFNTLLTIREAQARIQKAKDGREKREAALETLEPLLATAIEIGYGIPRHIYSQIMALDSLIGERDIEEVNMILKVLPHLLKALRIDSLSEPKKQILEEMQQVIKALNKDLKQAVKARNKELKRKAFSSAQGKARKLQELTNQFNDHERFAPVSRALVWDMHALKAELFHQIRVNFALLENKKLDFEYAISAYLECEKSGSEYDRKMRIDDIEADTGLTEEKIKKFKRKYGDNY